MQRGGDPSPGAQVMVRPGLPGTSQAISHAHALAAAARPPNIGPTNMPQGQSSKFGNNLQTTRNTAATTSTMHAGRWPNHQHTRPTLSGCGSVTPARNPLHKDDAVCGLHVVHHHAVPVMWRVKNTHPTKRHSWVNITDDEQACITL